MEQLLKALADLLAPYLPKPDISDIETAFLEGLNKEIDRAIEKELNNLNISDEIWNELGDYDFDDAIQNYLDYNNYQPADQFVDRSDCEEIVSNKINEYIDEALRDKIKNVLRDATIEVIN
tara:strand:+ start:195 stop:557 length:363 start_codon:yes stop_codon:yes gene_type:complete